MAARTPAPSRRYAPPAARGGDPRRAGGGRPPAPRRRRWLPSWQVVLGGLLLLALMVVGAGAFAWATTPVPSLSASALEATTTVYYADGETVMGELNNGIDRKPLTEEQMPTTAKQAAVASEDRTFYENSGVSITGIGRAVYGVVTGKSGLGGGSTITQQYVKNITGNDQRAYTRKATEAVQALKVDQQYSKDQILTSYLNTVYFGRGAYGVGAAAEAYFGLTDASQLTAEQAALLIGILPAPSAWDPATDPDNAQKRYSYVMGGMQQMGYLTAEQVAASPTMPGVVEQQKPQWASGPNGYVLNAIVKEVAAAGPTVATLDGGTQLITTEDQVQTAGLKIVSTIDQAKQDAAIAAMADPDVYPVRNRPDSVRAGLVSIDPRTGGVVAMYGGPDPLGATTGVDAVMQARAQAGSTFKPFTLLAALEEGIDLSETYSGSSPQTFDGYKVSNFGSGNGEQFGRINLVKATADSVNTVYVKLNEEVGPQKTADVAGRLGVPMDTSTQGVLSNVLGTSDVHPIDMAGAYAALANGGARKATHFVASASSPDGHVYYAGEQSSVQAVAPDVAANAVYAMQAVTKSGGTAASVGKALGKRPVAGKTGTTNDNKAAWFNGFTPQLETAVVLYNSDIESGAQLSLGSWGGFKEITGGTVPAKIWTAYMTEALQGAEVLQFPKPSESVSSEPTPTATATPTPTETATASPSESPSASESPSDDPTDGGDGDGGSEGDAPTDDATDARAAGPAGVVDRAVARLGAAGQGPQGTPPGQAQGRAAAPAGPGSGRSQG